MKNPGGRARTAARAAALALLALVLAGCRGDETARDADSADRKAAAAAMEAAKAGTPKRLPREFLGVPLGISVSEARIRMPDLKPDFFLAFAAAPTYYICDEIGYTHNFILAQGPARSQAYRVGPGRAGLESLEVYVFNNEVTAVRGVYLDAVSRARPFAEFVSEALEMFGKSTRAEAVQYSDGAKVRYVLWRDQDTAILIGETDAPEGPFRSRYVYLIDARLLNASMEAQNGRKPEDLNQVKF